VNGSLNEVLTHRYDVTGQVKNTWHVPRATSLETDVVATLALASEHHECADNSLQTVSQNHARLFSVMFKYAF